ncbi:multicopper oxidase family protein [Phytoactinopolyspora halotolerans]|uniref:Multicopper oxidase domain-containing protein n=1 Tax=Phytoactinopolyspora halotolerans TaxID=1981512 RepID=A0A6L9SG35_9ACTN|nr:multicopper oxidase domain-containing protein [Phytoactinopolyspora halotolerans]NEE03614.1 multicopper oxidase domain-containing protein [Phytoactinopolyspora halotolerans]
MARYPTCNQIVTSYAEWRRERSFGMSKTGRRTGTIKRHAPLPGNSTPVARNGMADVSNGDFLAPVADSVSLPQPREPRSTAEPMHTLPEVRSYDGVLEHTLRVSHQTLHVGDHSLRTYAYNGTVPGEVLRLQPGDRLKLRLDNATGPTGTAGSARSGELLTPVTTSAGLRMRGSKGTGSRRGNDVPAHLAPGDSQRYEYEVPADHPAGLHWYRIGIYDEATRTTLPGPAVPMIITGDIDRAAQIRSIRERTMVLTALPVRGSDTAPDLSVNGRLHPEIDIRPGEIQRWRVLNADPDESVWLHVDGHTLYQVGQDGIPFSDPHPARSIMLAPGNRAELLVRANRAGHYRIYSGHIAGTGSPAHASTEVATLAVDGRPMFNRMPRELIEAPEFPTHPVVQHRKVHLGVAAAETHDGLTVTAGTVEEWTLINDDAQERSVHLHGNPFQVLDMQGAGPGDPCRQTDPSVWRDTHRLPPNGQMTVRTYIRPDTTGSTVYRCRVAASDHRGLTDTLSVTPAH